MVDSSLPGCCAITCGTHGKQAPYHHHLTLFASKASSVFMHAAWPSYIYTFREDILCTQRMQVISDGMSRVPLCVRS